MLGVRPMSSARKVSTDMICDPTLAAVLQGPQEVMRRLHGGYMWVTCGLHGGYMGVVTGVLQGNGYTCTLCANSHAQLKREPSDRPGRRMPRVCTGTLVHCEHSQGMHWYTMSTQPGHALVHYGQTIREPCRANRRAGGGGVWRRRRARLAPLLAAVVWRADTTCVAEWQGRRVRVERLPRRRRRSGPDDRVVKPRAVSAPRKGGRWGSERDASACVRRHKASALAPVGGAAQRGVRIRFGFPWRR